MKTLKLLITIGILATVISMPAQSTSSLKAKFDNQFKKEYFKLGALFQFVFDHQSTRTISGENGFSAGNLRLKLSGEFDGGWGYAFQTSFVKSPSILDAVLYYKYSEQLKISAGQFKAPFSGEYLISAADIDFVNRSQIASSLAPKRQIGVQVSGFLNDGLLEYRAGVFNGNGIKSNGNDNGKFLYAGRLVMRPQIFNDGTDGALEIGTNAGFSEDSSSSFDGKRFYFGTDIRLIYEKLLISGEYISNKITPVSGAETNPNGFQATLGYKVRSNIQILARYDSFEPASGTNSDWIIIGVNFIPSASTGIQVNYLMDKNQSGFEYNQLLVNAQIVL